MCWRCVTKNEVRQKKEGKQFEKLQLLSAASINSPATLLYVLVLCVG